MILGHFFARLLVLQSFAIVNNCLQSFGKLYRLSDSTFQACVTASQMHDTLDGGGKYNPVLLPQHVQAQINRGKDDLPLFLRFLLVAFVRHENKLVALGRLSLRVAPNPIPFLCLYVNVSAALHVLFGRCAKRLLL